MAKKEIRVITASEDIGALIDRGAEVKTSLDNLTYEDKGLKFKISAAAAPEIDTGEGESSIRMEGDKSAAVVSQTEKMTIKASAEHYPGLKKSVEDGFLSDVVVIKKSLVVPPDDITRAAKALEAAGITANVIESLTVKAEDVRAMRDSEASSLEETEVRHALEGCLETDVSYRVSYKKKG